MLYDSLLPFVGTNMVEKSAKNETRLEIKKTWGKLKIYIVHTGKIGDTIKESVQVNLEHFTGIPNLIEALKKVGTNRIEQGAPENHYSFFCEVRGGELFVIEKDSLSLRF